ncbi:restriction endonuclease subunit S [Bacteroides fragilis]|uniref:restriction endonuclease subunit S n=3 Tax=Bacteroides fragilis TaxID=817 RepID=UPI00044B9A66|nr:restriction endonuclease subunit S [Bacteroides fragilis]EYA19944.1 type I restriction modification DNA specificity domain protein [Bacteroides fragilis str. 1007-1-F \
MADNKNNSERNVPPLRFPEFSGEWKKCTIGGLTIKVGSGVTPRGGEAVYKTEGHPFVRSQNVGLGHLLLDDIAYIDEDTHQRQKNTELQLDDVLLNITGASIGRSAIVTKEIVRGNVNQHVCIIRTKDNLVSSFLCNFLLSNYGQKQIDSFQAGGNRQGLNFEQIKSIKIAIPTVNEQSKIAQLLQLVEERIATQNKIIEKYESLIKGIAQHCIKESISGITYVKLGDICQISTGKLDANAQVDNGIYPFFTCAEQPFKIDNFAFDTEALLISGNGANLGYINYYKGKFNAYQRTYVLDLFSENIQYIKWALKVLLPKRIAIEKSSSNTPYIVLSTLTDLRLPIPNKSNQCHIAKLMQSLERKLSSQIALNGSYNKLKQYLLRQMFI